MRWDSPAQQLSSRIVFSPAQQLSSRIVLPFSSVTATATILLAPIGFLCYVVWFHLFISWRRFAIEGLVCGTFFWPFASTAAQYFCFIGSYYRFYFQSREHFKGFPILCHLSFGFILSFLGGILHSAMQFGAHFFWRFGRAAAIHCNRCIPKWSLALSLGSSACCSRVVVMKR